MSPAVREPQLLATYEATIVCDGCDLSTTHELHAMDDEAVVCVCCACGAITVLR